MKIYIYRTNPSYDRPNINNLHSQMVERIENWLISIENSEFHQKLTIVNKNDHLTCVFSSKICHFLLKSGVFW